MGTWSPNGYFSHTELFLLLLCSTGGKWEENSRAKSGGEKHVKGRNHEDPTFSRFQGPDFCAAISFPSFFCLTTNCSYSIPPFFLWTGQQTWIIGQEKNGRDKVWERKARGRRARYSSSDFARPFSLAFFFSRHDELNKVRTARVYSIPPFSLRKGQQHVCTCLNISFLLNLLATGSWYTALGQELILSKMSFSLSSDKGNKLKTKEEK